MDIEYPFTGKHGDDLASDTATVRSTVSNQCCHVYSLGHLRLGIRPILLRWARHNALLNTA
jgi:hypothetical protein